jgi:hypothetical protein
MELALFEITGKIKAINQKKVEMEERIKVPSCRLNYPPPYKVGTKIRVRKSSILYH